MAFLWFLQTQCHQSPLPVVPCESRLGLCLSCLVGWGAWGGVGTCAPGRAGGGTSCLPRGVRFCSGRSLPWECTEAAGEPAESSGEGAAGQAGGPLVGVGGGVAGQLPCVQIQGPQRSGCDAWAPLGEVLWGVWGPSWDQLLVEMQGLRAWEGRSRSQVAALERRTRWLGLVPAGAGVWAGQGPASPSPGVRDRCYRGRASLAGAGVLPSPRRMAGTGQPAEPRDSFSFQHPPWA